METVVIGQLLPMLSESNNGHDKQAVAIYLDSVLVGPRPELYNTNF